VSILELDLELHLNSNTELNIELQTITRSIILTLNDRVLRLC
jgi:formyltetrahydrofolate synthetase